MGVETGLYPYYKSVESASRPRVTVEGREVINFGSNNYLSLSYHPQVIEAAVAATYRFGTGVTGSRLLNGTLTLHRELEAELAEFYDAPACLVFSTGYVANACAIAGFLGRHDGRDRRQGGPQLAAVGGPAVGGLDAAVPPQRRRPARDGAGAPPRRPSPRASSSTGSTRWAATPRRSPRSWSSAAGSRTRSSSTTRPTGSACSARAVEGPPRPRGSSPTSTW